jgi:hypothetical protein
MFNFFKVLIITEERIVKQTNSWLLEVNTEGRFTVISDVPVPYQFRSVQCAGYV